MEASNPLPEVCAASPKLPMVPPTSVQSGAIASPAVQAPMSPAAVISPAALQYQFNIQQSLLMQQYALAQQAVVKAATVKSAAEVAAARAAEISKQLEKKSQSSSSSKSKSRSKSRSHSPSILRSKSKSRSRSKSRSHSPIRKRRGRSNSLSPIRYRRDYHSSYRPREHYGYRGYNYRSYYRGGYNDYSGYRYGRERDYHYRRRRSRSRDRRRSRTRSRTPRRRSRTRSRSPRRDRSTGRWSKSFSPPARNSSQTRSPRKKTVSPHARRDGTKSRPIPTGSVSREAVRSPSASSGSIGASPPTKSRSRSLSNVKDHNEDGSPTTERSYGLDEEERLASMGRKGKNASSMSNHGRTQSSRSPSRSLSVSLNSDRNRNASDRVASKRMPTVRKSPSDDRDRTPKRTSSVEKSSSYEREQTPKRTSSDEHASPVYRDKPKDSEGGTKNPGGGRRIRKPTRSSNAIFHDVSGSGDEITDDWRDDLKQLRGKGTYTHKDGDFDALEDRSREQIDSSVKAIANNMEPKVESPLQNVSSEGHSDNMVAVGEQDVMSEKPYGHVVIHGEAESVRGQRRHLSVSEIPNKACDDGDQPEKVSDEEVIFEGPKPASPVCEQRYNVGAEEGHLTDMESPSSKRFAFEKVEVIGSLRIAEGDDDNTKGSNRRHSREKTIKDRSRSRDGKKYEGESGKREKRRDRHKKHRKKHRNVEEESAESDGDRRHHKRKHRKEEEQSQRERKKRKRRHRKRSSSVSAEESSSDSETDVRSRRRRGKRSSKKHKAAKRDVESPLSSASLE